MVWFPPPDTKASHVRNHNSRKVLPETLGSPQSVMAEAEARGSPQRPSAAGANLGLALIPLCVSRVACRKPLVNVGYTGCGGSGEDGLESSQEEVPKPEDVQRLPGGQGEWERGLWCTGLGSGRGQGSKGRLLGRRGAQGESAPHLGLRGLPFSCSRPSAYSCLRQGSLTV